MVRWITVVLLAVILSGCASLMGLSNKHYTGTLAVPMDSFGMWYEDLSNQGGQSSHYIMYGGSANGRALIGHRMSSRVYGGKYVGMYTVSSDVSWQYIDATIGSEFTFQGYRWMVRGVNTTMNTLSVELLPTETKGEVQ